MGIFDFWRATSPAPQIEGPTAAPESLDVVERGDAMGTFINTIAGLGTDDDSGATVVPAIYRETFRVEQWLAAYEGGLYGRLIDMDPDDAFSKGYDVKVEDDDGAEIATQVRERLDELQVDARIQHALKIGAAAGEARLWPVDQTGASGLERPWDPDKVRRLYAVQVLDPREFSPADGQNDPRAMNWGQPDTYQITPAKAWQGYGRGKYGYPKVHHSRLLRAYGFDTPFATSAGRTSDLYSGAALAWGQRWWDAIAQNATVDQSASRAAVELSVAVFGMNPEAYEKSTRGGAASGNRMLARLINIRKRKSMANMIALVPGESYTRANVQISGFSQLSERAIQMLCAVTGKSQSQLFGEPPSGLTSDKGSWWAAREMQVTSYQDERVRPLLRPIIAAILAELGHAGRSFKIRFRPLAEQTPESKSTVYLRTMQATALAINAGIIPPDHGRHHFGPDGFVVDLPPIAEEDLSDDDTEDPDALVATMRQRLAEVQEEDTEDDPSEEVRADASYSPEFRRRRFKIPAGAKGNARKVRRWEEEHGSAVPKGTAAGQARERQLADDDTVTGQDLIEIAGFLKRHKGNEEVDPKFKDEPWRDAGYVGWLRWGGDSAASWAIPIVEREANQKD